MTQFNDDLYLGNAQTLGVINGGTPNPTIQAGVGPMGRTAYLNIVPLTKAANNVALAQHTVAATALTLTAGTGVTAGVAPDGSGRAVIVLDVPRAVSYTTNADMSAVTMTTVGFDQYGALLTQTTVLPASATVVNTLKAFKSILSMTASATDASNLVSAGTADIFGMPYSVPDAGYVVSNKWANVLADDAGTFVAAVATIPSTAALGDVRGTYAPSSASNGSRRLVMGLHLQASQSGANAQRYTTSGGTGALGVPQV